MFSLRTLLVVVAVAALAAGAIVSQSFWVSSGFVGVAVVILLWAVVEHRKPFWYAFAIFGIGYFVAIFLLDGLLIVPKTHWITIDLFGPRGQLYNETINRMRLGAVHSTVALLFGLCAGLFYEWRTKKDGT
jgi:hypothetical protein